MARQELKVVHLNQYRVAPELLAGTEAPPPPPSATLELTYFDLFLLSMPPVTRLFLYRFSRTEHFLNLHFPNLKRSLSHSLAVFYPLAGHIIRPAGAMPFIRYEDGDAVDVTVVESQDDFEELAGGGPKESSIVCQLVPELLVVSQDGSKQPAMAVQVILFPGCGVGLAVKVSHLIADGCSSTHFIKTWAALCCQLEHNQGNHAQEDGVGDHVTPIVTAAAEALPIFDRSLVQDSKGLRQIYFEHITKAIRERPVSLPKPTFAPAPAPALSLLRATFPLSHTNLDLLRRRAGAPPGVRYSSFTVAHALTWVCTVKARNKLEEEHKLLIFTANFRSRNRPPLPASYFGNCLSGVMLRARTADLAGDDGIAVASAAIFDGVQDLNNAGGILKHGEDAYKVAEKNRQECLERIVISGSPSFRVYQVDFGWGRPAKVELVSVEMAGAASIADTADGPGGVEIGVMLPPDAMAEFERLWRSAMETDD